MRVSGNQEYESMSHIEQDLILFMAYTFIYEGLIYTVVTG